VDARSRTRIGATAVGVLLVLMLACSKKSTTPQEGPFAPALAPIGDQLAVIGDTLRLVVRATDGDSDSIVLEARNLPANATFVDSTNGRGVFEFAPDSTQSAEYLVTFVASDASLADSEVVSVNASFDLTGWFVLPGPGYNKFFSNGPTRTYVQDTIVNGFNTVDVALSNGRHVYTRSPDRAWVATFDTASGGVLFLLNPPLPGFPDTAALGVEMEAQSEFVLQTGGLPVRRFSRLDSIGVQLTVPAGSFDSVAVIRQEFWRIITNPLMQLDTLIDSTYQWFAPGVDEIRRIEWLDGSPTVVREFVGGTVGGRTYP